MRLLILAILIAAGKPVEFARPVSALEEGRAHSQESKTRAQLQFVNLTDRELKLYWLDFRGKRHPFGTVKPGQRALRKTWLTHTWLVATPHDKGLAIFTPAGAKSTVLIDPMAAPRTGSSVAQMHSDKAGAKTTLTFVNPTNTPVSLFWVDYKGHRDPRGSVGAHSELLQPTFANHVWVIATPDGKSEAAFVAKPTPQTAVLAPDIQ